MNDLKTNAAQAGRTGFQNDRQGDFVLPRVRSIYSIDQDIGVQEEPAVHIIAETTLTGIQFFPAGPGTSREVRHPIQQTLDIVRRWNTVFGVLCEPEPELAVECRFAGFGLAPGSVNEFGGRAQGQVSESHASSVHETDSVPSRAV